MNGFKVKPKKNATQGLKNKRKFRKLRKFRRRFDFPSLPYVCQKRFAEICDPASLKIFAAINASTTRLAKRCHVIDEVELDAYRSTKHCRFSIPCYCGAEEFCRSISDPLTFKGKLTVMNKIKITNTLYECSQLFQYLPISFDSVRILHFTVHRINLNDLKMILKPNLNVFDFYGGLISDISIKEFAQFICDFSKKLKELKLVVSPFSKNYT